VAEQHHGRRTRTLVRLVEYAAEQRTLSGDAERGRGDLRRHCWPRTAVRAHQVDARVAIGAEVRDRPGGAPELVVVQDTILVGLHLQIPVLDLHDAIPVGERQFRARDDAEHLEGDGPEPDAERHRQAADNRQTRILHEHSDAELQVERHSAEQRGAAPLAKRLAVLLHAPECDERAPSRFVVIELLLAHEPLRLHLDMEADLVVDPGLGGAPGEKAQPRSRGVEPRHGMLR
jgi:hypothetical protein